MTKAPYLVLHVSSVEECQDIERLAERVRIVLTQADSVTLHGTNPTVEEWLGRDGNLTRTTTAVMSKLRAKRDAQA